MKMKKFGKLLGGILLCAALLTATAMTAFALPPVEGPQYDGIDISRWQGGSIDFARVKEAGYGIVYIRAGGGGDYTDPDFERNYTEAKAAGMQIGFYYYVDAENETEAGEQAAHFASLVRDKEPDCRPAMEFVIDGLDNATVNRLALAFLQRAEELSGFAMCVYTNAYNAGNVYSGAITAYPLWIAEYDVERPSDIGTWTAWAGWQYDASASVPGVDGNVDRDIFTNGIFLPETPPASSDASAPATGRTALVWIPAALIGCTLAASCWSAAKRRPDPPFFRQGPP